MKRFVVQEGTQENYYVVTDQTNGIVIVFEKGDFNGTQKVTELKNIDPNDFMLLARHLREVGDWLVKNHSDKI
jgi:hypothetical protein